MKTVYVLGLVLVGAGALGLFLKRPEPEPERAQLSAESPVAEASTLDMGQTELPPNHPPVGGAVDGPRGIARPGSVAAHGSPAMQGLQGEILETIDVGAYTYVRIKTATGEQWAAVNRATLKIGQQISIPRVTLMQAFHSKSLNRTFDKIYFGSLDEPAAGGGGAAPGVVPQGTAAPYGAAAPHGAASPYGSATSAKPAGTVLEVDIASGELGVRISSLLAAPVSFSGKRVRVRGEVTKITTGVNGKSFLHLQDGTRDVKSEPADLAVTTTAVPAEGSIVTFEGKLATDVDMGFGYKYALLLEDAQLIAE